MIRRNNTGYNETPTLKGHTMSASINRLQLTSELNFRMDEARMTSDEKSMNTLIDLKKKLNEIFARDTKFDSEITMTIEEFCAAIIAALSLK